MINFRPSRVEGYVTTPSLSAPPLLNQGGELLRQKLPSSDELIVTHILGWTPGVGRYGCRSEPQRDPITEARPKRKRVNLSDILRFQAAER